MSKIVDVDKNFIIADKIGKTDIKFINAEEKPFKVYGIFKEDGKYRRLPESVAKTVSDGVYSLHANTSGGRVRFKTDSEYVAIIAKMENICKVSHCAFVTTAGFDLYADGVHKKAFIPPIDMETGYESIIEFDSKKEREITIYFPLYSDVKDLYIGIQENSVLKEAEGYKNQKPVVYYGNSITQGACASRPGMSYQGIISRRFNCDFVNLGFSGSAKGEDEIADYIKNLEMTLFVYDYDQNATVERLEETHEKMFKTIRNANPDLPVIMMSRPDKILNKYGVIMRGIIERTYKNAVADGDKNVYFIDGAMRTMLCGHDGTVDGTHLTDFGYMSTAKALGDIIEKIDLI